MLLKAAVQIPDVGPHMLHQLSIQDEFKPQHPMRTGMLWPHLQHQVITLSFIAHPVFIANALL
jgi:hypothetical protein